MGTERPVLSARVDAELAEQVERRAKQLGVTRGRLMERLIREGLRMEAHPGIVFVTEAAGRRARLAGTRLDVWVVVEAVRQSGSTEAAAARLEAPRHWVETALRYYAAYPDEVREATAAAEEAWARAEAEAERTRALLPE
jgi:uncharacterized protein (DUF433 family)